jgi:hypothetical protein
MNKDYEKMLSEIEIVLIINTLLLAGILIRLFFI